MGRIKEIITELRKGIQPADPYMKLIDDLEQELALFEIDLIKTNESLNGRIKLLEEFLARVNHSIKFDLNVPIPSKGKPF